MKQSKQKLLQLLVVGKGVMNLKFLSKCEEPAGKIHGMFWGIPVLSHDEAETFIN